MLRDCVGDNALQPRSFVSDMDSITISGTGEQGR
jgi:hypothetical protein